MTLSSCCSAPTYYETDGFTFPHVCSACHKPCDLQPPAESRKEQSACCGSPVDHEECPCWSAGCMGPNHRCKKCGSTCYLKKEGEKITNPPPAESIEFVEVTPDIQKQMDDVMQLLQTSEPEPNCHKCGKPVECQAAIPPENRTLDGHICEYSSKPLQTSEIENIIRDLEQDTTARRERLNAIAAHIRTLEKERDKYYVQAEVAKEQTTGFLGEMKKLESKLSIAVEALQELSTLGNGSRPGNSIGNTIAQNALSKILPPSA